MKKLIAIILCAGMLLAFAGCNNDTSDQPSGSATPGADTTPAPTAVEPQIIKCEMVIKDYGVIKIDLYAHKAPQTVYNFVYLARQGFYNGIVLHRLVQDTAIYGGVYTEGWKERVPEVGRYTIFGEFSANEFENTLSHGKGVIAMARLSKDMEDGTSKYDTASTEFYICLNTANTIPLNGEYATFGVVTEGMEIFEEIAKLERRGETIKEPPVITLVSIYGPELPEPDFIFHDTNIEG